MGSFVKNVLCLFLITSVAGLSLGYVYDVTKDPIAQMEEKTRQDAYLAVFTDASSFTDMEYEAGTLDSALQNAGIEGVRIDSVVTAADASGNAMGYVINVTTSKGYGGDISLSVGIDNDGVVRGVEILSISETAGLGMKAKEEKFRSQFKDKSVRKFAYTKSGAASDFEIDAISGATITTSAVTDAVNGALVCFEKLGGYGI